MTVLEMCGGRVCVGRSGISECLKHMQDAGLNPPAAAILKKTGRHLMWARRGHIALMLHRR